MSNYCLVAKNWHQLGNATHVANVKTLSQKCLARAQGTKLSRRRGWSHDIANGWEQRRGEPPEQGRAGWNDDSYALIRLHSQFWITAVQLGQAQGSSKRKINDE